MRTIISGSRKGFDYRDVCVAILLSEWESEISEVVCGGAPGVDMHGAKWAHFHNKPIKVFPARWDLYGHAAGPMRNQEMAAYAEALIAVWDGKSRGTAHMISEARRRGLKVYVWELEARPLQQEMPL